MWSLGVVTLLLLTSGYEVEITDNIRKEQKEIGNYLRGIFAKMAKPPSNNGKRFLRDCLRIDPLVRMSALRAELHDWLCRPSEHREFFEFLDRKMFSEWKPQDELKPMPLELPSLGTSVTQEPEFRCSHYFASEATPPPPSTSSETGCSNMHPPSSGGEAPTELEIDRAPHAPNQSSPTNIGGLVHEVQVKREESPYDGFRKPMLPEQSGHRINRKKKSRYRGHEPDLHPLPGLDRHLTPTCSNPRHRQQVLDELERSNVKFLVNSESVKR
jgi:serine/threonine protein kinase